MAKKSVKEMIKTEPYIKSKFRTKTYNGWEIVHIARVNNDPKHFRYWYYLRRHCVSDRGRKFYETITLSGATMKAIYSGKKKISDVIVNKTVLSTKHKCRVLQNTIMAKFTED